MSYVLKKTVCERFSQVFLLPARGKEQDWDIELSDKDRVVEFIEYLESNESELDDDEIVALSALILASLDDLANSESFSEHVWNRAKTVLVRHREILLPLIEYWSCINESSSSDDVFAITRFVRAID